MTAFETHRSQFAALVIELTRMAVASLRRVYHDPDAMEEAVQNSLALTWQSYHALIEQDRAGDPGIIKSILWYSLKQTRAGRALSRSGNTNAKDATTAARTGKVRFESVDLRQFESDSTPIPERVAFRIDLPKFLGTLNDRQRDMADDLMAGERTQDVAKKYDVTPGAVSQFRNRFKDLLEAYLAE